MYARKLAFLICDVICGVLGAAMMTVSSMIISVHRDIGDAAEPDIAIGAILIVTAGCLYASGGILGLVGAILDHSILCLTFFFLIIVGMAFALPGAIVSLWYQKTVSHSVHYRPVPLGIEVTSVVFHHIEKNSKCCGFTGVQNYLDGEDLMNVPVECCNDSAGDKTSETCVNTTNIFGVQDQIFRFYKKGCRGDIIVFFKSWTIANAILALVALAIAGAALYFVNKYKGTPHY